MNSSIIRFFLIVFGWPLILLLMIISYEWIRDVYFIPPIEIPKTDPIQHPAHHQFGTNALLRFSELSLSKQNLLIENLKSNLIPMEQWLKYLQQSDYEILVISENHEEATRQFLAKEFFSNFKIDGLFLEATPEELARIRTQIEGGVARVPMLDADISTIIRATRIKNPSIILDGIEETERQRKYRFQDHIGSRDETIALNFWSKFRPGQRYAILFGALHVTKQTGWLFEPIRTIAPQSIAEKMLNIRVLGEHQDGPLEAFVFFLDEIGIEREGFVISDTNSLHPLIYDWFALLTQQTLGQFRTLIVFRSYP